MIFHGLHVDTDNLQPVVQQVSRGAALFLALTQQRMNITLWLIALRIAQSGQIHCIVLGTGPCFVFFQCDFQVYVTREPQR